jgi:hypothetical protein
VAVEHDACMLVQSQNRFCWAVQVLLQGVAVEQYACMLTAESAGTLADSIPADPALWPNLAKAKDALKQVAESVRAVELYLHCSSCGALAAAAVQVLPA